MRVRAHRAMTAQQHLRHLTRFCKAHGAQVVKDAYGWTTIPPDSSTVDTEQERFWTFTDDELAEPNTVVGWGSLDLNTKAATDDEASLSIGVFPKFQRQGYRAAILRWMVDEARRLGATVASQVVYKSNEAHYKRCMREAHTAGSEWIYAGDNWYPPPGYGYFVLLLDRGQEEKADAPDHAGEEAKT